jgi:twinkle protein
MNLHTVQKAICWKSMPTDYPDRENYIGKFHITECLAAFHVYKEQLINVQYRDMYKNWAFESGADLVFFNADVIAKNKIIIITEGWMDAVACAEAGLWNVCSVPNGAHITPDEKRIFEETGSIEILSEPDLKYLDNCWDEFKNVEEVVIATDNDAPGQKLMEVLRRRFSNVGKILSFINFNLLPEEAGKKRKDFNDVLFYYGPEAVIMLYEKRQKFRSKSVIRAGDVRDEILRHFESGITPARKVGWLGMDPHFGYYPGDLMVSLGYPASGKTAFNQNLMIAISKKFNTRWMIYSPENYPVSRFVESMMEIYSGKSLDKTKKRSFLVSAGITYEEAITWVDEYFRFASRRSAFSLQELREITVSEGCQGLFVDPWNRLVKSANKKGIVGIDYIQEELTEQIAYGLDTGITTIITVHPATQDKKNRKYNADGEYDHPSAFEAEMGKIWFSSAHVMYTVHRPKTSDPTNKTTNVYVQKLKDRNLYGYPTGDMNPLQFEMVVSCRRLLLNGQTPLDSDSPMQLSLYDDEDYSGNNNLTNGNNKESAAITAASAYGNPDDLPF